MRLTSTEFPESKPLVRHGWPCPARGLTPRGPDYTQYRVAQCSLNEPTYDYDTTEQDKAARTEQLGAGKMISVRANH